MDARKPSDAVPAALRWTVYSLGVLLLGGVVLLFTLIMNKPEAKEQSIAEMSSIAPAAGASAEPAVTECANRRLALPAGERIEAYYVDDDLHTFLLGGAAGWRVVRLDACRGKVINVLQYEAR